MLLRTNREITGEIAVSDNKPDGRTERYTEIDGVRGIAAILVVFCHLACVFMPGLYSTELANTGFEQIWTNSPLNILTNGNASVQLFFVLSGFFITRKVYLNREKSLVSPVKTYIKLLRVIIPAVILSSVLMASGQMYHLQALDINPGLWFVEQYNDFDVSVIDVVKDVFFRTFISGSEYVGPFWTIHIEFWGSILISVSSYYIFSMGRNRKGLYIIFGIISLCAMEDLLPFFVGAFAYDCIHEPEKDDTWLGKTINFCIKHLCPVLMIAGIYLVCINRSVTGIWTPLRIIPRRVLLCRSIGNALCVMCIHENRLLRLVFSAKPLQLLGRISAYVYAFHWPIILSLGCGMYILLKDMNYNYAVAIISVSVLLTTCLLAFLYTKALPLILNAEQKMAALIKSIPVKNQKKN